MWEPTDPDAWQGEIPPEWEPEECEHPMYLAARRLLCQIETDLWIPDPAAVARYAPWGVGGRPRWVSDRLIGEVGG